ncbi:hypothetical protein KL931_004502 [Ogataea haglerorum]|nr:hypothetical protein KL931_004502 [Ogataea haglerorum]
MRENVLIPREEKSGPLILQEEDLPLKSRFPYKIQNYYETTWSSRARRYPSTSMIRTVKDFLPYVILGKRHPLVFLRFTNRDNLVTGEDVDLQLQVQSIEHRAAELEMSFEP